MGTGLNIEPIALAGAARISSRLHQDSRGVFARFFCEQELSSLLNGRTIRQINFSRTKQCGAVRGLHFQRPPAAEDKFVRCLRGQVFDVMVDLRADSSTFGQWFGTELNSDQMNMLYIPRGFAHGFQTLTENCELLYLHTEFYCPDCEGGFRCDSPELNIDWPLPIAEHSERDGQLPVFTHAYEGLRL